MGVLLNWRIEMSKKEKADTVFNVITIIVMVVVLSVVSFMVIKLTNNEQQVETTKVYVQKWQDPDTGIYYILSDIPITPCYNADGTYYKGNGEN